MGQGGYPPQVNVSVDYARASSQVSLPAIFMMVLAGLAIFFDLISLAMNVLGMGMGTLGRGGPEERFAALFSGGFGIAFGLLGILANGVILFGALKMKSLQSYALAMAAAILSMLPCSCCCLISLPVGIWALVVLLDGNVKAAFRS